MSDEFSRRLLPDMLAKLKEMVRNFSEKQNNAKTSLFSDEFEEDYIEEQEDYEDYDDYDELQEEEELEPQEEEEHEPQKEDNDELQEEEKEYEEPQPQEELSEPLTDNEYVEMAINKTKAERKYKKDLTDINVNPDPTVVDNGEMEKAVSNIIKQVENKTVVITPPEPIDLTKGKESILYLKKRFNECKSSKDIENIIDEVLTIKHNKLYYSEELTTKLISVTYNTADSLAGEKSRMKLLLNNLHNLKGLAIAILTVAEHYPDTESYGNKLYHALINENNYETQELLSLK